MPLKIEFTMSYSTYHRANSLCATLGVHDLDQLWDQLIEELEWNTYHATPVRAALLSRAVGKAVAVQNSSSEAITFNSTSKE